MFTSMMRRAYLLGANLDGPVVFGSGKPSIFISDVIDGTDSLDIIVLGDSNTGSGGKGANGFWGYHNGISQALTNLGAQIYGTPIYPAMTDWFDSAPATGFGLQGWRSSAYIFSKSASGGLQNGNKTGGATPYAEWTPATVWNRYGNYGATPDPSNESWAYIASGDTYSQVYNAVELAETHPLNKNGQTLYHRVRHGQFSASGGSFRGRARAYTGSPVYATGPVENTQGSNPFALYEYSFTLSSSPSVYIHVSWSGGATAAGPVAIHSHSVYAKQIGFAVTSHGYFSGGDSDTIRSEMVGIEPNGTIWTFRRHLQELRERQIAAGGSGRVLLVMHSGINGNETSADWTKAHGDIRDKYLSAWQTLGYPVDDFAVLSWVGVQSNAADNSNSGSGGNLVAVRNDAITFGKSNPLTHTVVDVKSLMNYSGLLYGTGFGASYYQRYNNVPDSGTDITVHLSGGGKGATAHVNDGYTVISQLILTSLLSAE